MASNPCADNSHREQQQNAKRPAKGSSAFAASVDVLTFRMPWTCSVAAVVTMMNDAIRLESAIPTYVSSLMRDNCLGASRGEIFSGCSASFAVTSSTSSAACQKKRYGLIVVPRTAMRAVKNPARGRNEGTNAPRTTCAQDTWLTNAVAT